MSLPFEVCMKWENDILLAFEMNEAPLTLDHGFPLRLIAPGFIGAKSVKWLTHIVIKDTESQGI